MLDSIWSLAGPLLGALIGGGIAFLYGERRAITQFRREQNAEMSKDIQRHLMDELAFGESLAKAMRRIEHLGLASKAQPQRDAAVEETVRIFKLRYDGTYLDGPHFLVPKYLRTPSLKR
jgi:hypothetical protein